MTGERQSAETALSAEEEMSIRALVDWPGPNWDDPRSTVLLDYIAHLLGALDAARAALPASTESTGAGETHVDYLATQLQETGRLTVFPGDEQAALAALRAIGVESFTIYAGAASGGVPAALDADPVPMWTAVAQSLADAGLTRAGRRNDFLTALASRGYTVARSASEPAGSAPETFRLSERHIFAANAILDRPSADPDDDAAIVARAVLRLAANSSEPEAPGLRERLRPIVAEWFDTGYEAGKLDADVLTDRVLAVLAAPGAAGQPAGTTNP